MLPAVVPGFVTLIVGDEVALLFPVIAVSLTVAATPARLPGLSEMEFAVPTLVIVPAE